MSLEALLFVILLNVTLWGGAALIACRLLAGFWDRVLGAAVLGWTVLIVGLQLVSLVRSLRFAPVALLVAAFFVVALFLSLTVLRKGTQVSGPHRPRRKRSSVWSVWRFSSSFGPATITLLLAVSAGVYYLARGVLLPVEPVSDAPIYHLYFAVRWWQAGRIALVATPFGELAATYFPANGALWFSWLVMLSGSELLAKVGQWPFWALAAACVYALGRRCGASRCAAVFPAALWATGVSVLVQGAGLANVDLIFTAWYLIACYFLIRYAQAASETQSAGTYSQVTGVPQQRILLLAMALAAGAALGTHATGLFFVPLLLLPAIGLTIARRWHHLALLACAIVLSCGYWYGRNWVRTGNPVYPANVRLLGTTVFPGWYDRAAMLQSGYHIPVEQLSALAAQYCTVIDVRPNLVWPRTNRPSTPARTLLGAIGVVHVLCWPLAIAIGLVAPLLQARRPEQATGTRPAWDSWLLFGLSVLSLLYTGVFWWIVPYQSQQRFLFPAAALAIIPLSRLLDGRKGLQFAVLLIVAAHLALPPGMALPPYPWQRPSETFYPEHGFAGNLLPAWRALEQASPAGGARVAYAGTNLPYYLFGQGLRNRVYYVNVNDHPGFLPHDYHLLRRSKRQTELSPNPWPDWYRENPDYDAWLANLRRLQIDLLFVARENQHGRPDAEQFPPFPIEYDWARRHPEHFEALPVATAPGLRAPWAYVFRVKQVDP